MGSRISYQRGGPSVSSLRGGGPWEMYSFSERGTPSESSHSCQGDGPSESDKSLSFFGVQTERRSSLNNNEVQPRMLEQLQEAVHGLHTSCSVCATLCASISETADHILLKRIHKLGVTMRELLDMQCPGHHAFFRAIEEQCMFEPRVSRRSRRQRVVIQSLHGSIHLHLPRNRYHFAIGRHGLKFGLVRREDIPGHPGRYLPIQSRRINLELMRRWQQECAADHQGDCVNPWRIERIYPVWLMDTQQRCLVSGDDVAREHDSSYICLSYRWGIPRYRTFKTALEDLQKPGSLDRIQNHLPRVISDSMKLVRDLGKRYLWADTICIPQDDKPLMETEFGRMGMIYGNAWLTIVAADGDGDSGLPGVSTRRSLSRVASFGKEKLMYLPFGTEYDPLHDTEYNDRAWTFQEYEMSSRKLIFVNHRVLWECTARRYDEHRMETEDSYGRTSRLQPSKTVLGEPDLDYYQRLTDEADSGGYNGRELTHDSDALRAISGMLTVLSRGFPGGFLYALPAMFFDLALCWRPPKLVDYSLRRRVPSENEREDVTGYLPSWSWIGWQGEVQCCNRRVNKTYRITTWYASRTPDGRNARPIHSCFRDRRSHRGPDLPPNRHASIETVGTDSTLDEQHFDHELLRRLPTPAMPSQMPYILGRTTGVRLGAYVDDEEESPTVRLYNHFRKCVGDLWLHSVEDISLFPSRKRGKKVEVVAICEQAYRESLFMSQGPLREYYLVLWVEWEKEVAYRRASGRVERKAWNRLPGRKEVDLVLG